MPLTETEQAKALRFMGYANWTSLASSFQLGFPAGSQPEFLVRDAFTRIREESIELIRRDINELECLENQISDTSRIKASKLGDMTLNADEFGDISQRMGYWRDMLAQDLGAYFNPFGSQGGTAAGGRNARVVG